MLDKCVTRQPSNGWPCIRAASRRAIATGKSSKPQTSSGRASLAQWPASSPTAGMWIRPVTHLPHTLPPTYVLTHSLTATLYFSMSTNTNTHTHTHSFECKYISICIYIYTRTHSLTIHTHSFECKYISICIYIYIYILALTRSPLRFNRSTNTL